MAVEDTSRSNSCALDIVESLKDESDYNLDESNWPLPTAPRDASRPI